MALDLDNLGYLLSRIRFRMNRSDNRGTLSYSQTSGMLWRLRNRAEMIEGRKFSDAQFAEAIQLDGYTAGGCDGSYVRQYMKLDEYGRPVGASKKMRFDTMRRCVGIACENGWFPGVRGALDMVNLMQRIEDEEVAFRTLNKWKALKWLKTGISRVSPVKIFDTLLSASEEVDEAYIQKAKSINRGKVPSLEGVEYIP